MRVLMPLALILSARDMFVITMMLTVLAALIAALVIHGFWPKTQPSPTAWAVFICAMAFHSAVVLLAALPQWRHLRLDDLHLDGYALRGLFCLVLWLTLYARDAADERQQIVEDSRQIRRETEAALHALRQQDHDGRVPPVAAATPEEGDARAPSPPAARPL